MLARNPQRVLAVQRRENVVALRPQHTLGELAQGRFILDHQQGLAAGAHQAALGQLGDGNVAGSDAWKIDAESGALSELAGDVNVAARLPDNGLAGDEAE